MHFARTGGAGGAGGGLDGCLAFVHKMWTRVPGRSAGQGGVARVQTEGQDWRLAFPWIKKKKEKKSIYFLGVETPNRVGGGGGEGEGAQAASLGENAGRMK